MPEQVPGVSQVVFRLGCAATASGAGWVMLARLQGSRKAMNAATAVAEALDEGAVAPDPLPPMPISNLRAAGILMTSADMNRRL